MSSNVSLGEDRPQDPGVALWFSWKGNQICIPVDRYLTPEANLQAIHHILEARCTELRHGTLALVRATFQGFMALPAPETHQHWKAVLELDGLVLSSDVEKAYRRLASKYHPDKPGGSNEKMAELNRAREEALAEL